MRINKPFVVAILFFFLNSVGLPYGLTYMTLLAPLFYLYIVRRTSADPVLPFVTLLSPFIIAHFINGVDNPGAYVASFLNVTGVYLFGLSFCLYLRGPNDLEGIFRRLLIINFILVLIAIPFFFTPFYGIFWIEQFLTQGINNFKRLRMFTYEASYYSTLMMPIVFFYLAQIMLKKNRMPVGTLLVLLFVPLLLSFSIGVLSAMLFSLAVTWLLHFRRLTRKKRVFNLLATGSVFLFAVFLLALIFFPDNTLFVRIGKIITGHDSSAKGRTFEAFMLADKIGALKSSWFGIGWGQLKIIGAETIRNYYNYPEDYGISIPNATAETIAVLGWVGFALRLTIEGFFFFRTKVWTNYYRMFLFLFIFLYQWTGSFLTNFAEYAIWILAFSPVFPQFDITGKPNHPFIAKTPK
jgi:hypothetical protein